MREKLKGLQKFMQPNRKFPLKNTTSLFDPSIKTLNQEAFKNKKKIGLVLSGGCIKAAAFHLGACAALEKHGFQFVGGSSKDRENPSSENGMKIQSYVGSSAGAIIATFLASGFDVNTIVQSFTQRKEKKSLFAFLRKDKTTASKPPFHLKPITYRDIFNINFKASSPLSFFSYLLDLFKISPSLKTEGGIEVFLKKSFKVNGLFNTFQLEKYFRQHVCTENSFQSLKSDLLIIATFLNQSERIIFGSPLLKKKLFQNSYASHTSISQAVAASTSFPPFFAPYCIENQEGKEQHFFDGDIRVPLSTDVAEEQGCDLILASYSIQPYHYNNNLGSLHQYGMPLILNQALYQIIEQKIKQQKTEKENLKKLFHSLQEELKSSSLTEEKKNKIFHLLRSQMQFKQEVDILYIHPDPQDEDMFFTDHFSLNTKTVSKIIEKGFKAGLVSLKGFHAKNQKTQDL